jgi:hypothetical protein
VPHAQGEDAQGEGNSACENLIARSFQRIRAVLVKIILAKQPSRRLSCIFRMA